MFRAGVLMTTFVSLSLCASCSDEENGSQSTSSLSFSVSISDDGSGGTGSRSAKSGQNNYYESRHFDNSELWLITSSEEGIDSTLFDSPSKATRATSVSTDNFGSVYSSFGVYAYVYSSSASWESSQSSATTYVSNGEVTKTGTNWAFSPSRFWPGGNYNIRFVAYAPYNAAGFTMTDNTPTVSYTVPASTAEQKDLLLATPDPVSGDYGLESGSMGLNFRHLLTAVKVKLASGMEGTVTNVTLSGVKGSGTYVYDADNGAWTTSGEDCTFSESRSVTASSTSDTEIIGDTDGTTFMMIPQTLGSGAELSVTITAADGTETTLTGSLEGREWLMGYTVTYRISATDFYDEPVFIVTGPGIYSYEGGSNNYTVQSYTKRTSNGNTTIRQTKWTATFVEDDGTTEIENPAWATLASMSGNGVSSETSSESYAATVSAQEYSEIVYPVFPETTVNERTGLSVYNLSNSAGAAAVQNTANCYVINERGKYSLPLVYGNAIKNGAANTGAYTSTSTRSGILKTFINHLGRGITSPYIYENVDADGNNLKAAKASLVWQDAKGLITDIALTGDNTAVEFNVGMGEDGIHQGNAVIAVEDSEGNIMWSWHLWVTDYELGNDLKYITYTDETTSASKTFALLPVSLGWCVTSTAHYPSRSVKVRFTQEGTGNTVVVTILQEEADVPKDGNYPYYQWGRKDPMLPSDGTSKSWTNKTWYNADGESSSSILSATDWGSGDDVITKGIQNPFVYCSNSSMDNTYYNLWAAQFINTKSNTSVKTVYDPCPAGYKVVLQNVYTTFTLDNGVFAYNPPGMYFECTTSSGAASTLYLPSLGYRGFSAAQKASISVGSNHGDYWSASPNATTHGSVIQFDSTGGTIHMQNGSATCMFRACGLGVRACVDD